MESRKDGGATGESTPDGGFPAKFSIEVVEDVSEIVEEMMRLGALGYFKEARELSDTLLPKYSHIFAVLAERMRLLLDQGDYSQLLKMAQTANRDGLSTNQKAILNLMQAIAKGIKSERVRSTLKWDSACDDAVHRNLYEMITGGSAVSRFVRRPPMIECTIDRHRYS